MKRFFIAQDTLTISGKSILEQSIDEIKNINVDIEKEVFIHGALCISYSGQCLMSSLIGGRSGNRGTCAGSCPDAV